MPTEQGDLNALKAQATQYLKRRDNRRALMLFESLLQRASTDSSIWLGAAECAIELGLGARALELLRDADTFLGESEREQWVNLRSEALRRFGGGQEGLAFIESWINRVSPEIASKLLLRKAAFHIGQKDTLSASASVRQAWALESEKDPSWLVSAANCAALSGEMGILADAGKRLLKSRLAPGGFCAYIFGRFYGLSVVGRILVGSVVAAFLLIPSLRPAYLAGLALLLVGALVTWWSRLVSMTLTLGALALGLAGAYGLVALAEVPGIGGALGISVLVLVLLAGFLAFVRSRRRRGSPDPGHET